MLLLLLLPPCQSTAAWQFTALKLSLRIVKVLPVEDKQAPCSITFCLVSPACFPLSASALSLNFCVIWRRTTRGLPETILKHHSERWDGCSAASAVEYSNRETQPHRCSSSACWWAVTACSKRSRNLRKPCSCVLAIPPANSAVRFVPWKESFESWPGGCSCLSRS